MTPDLMDAGAERIARHPELRHPALQTESGGRGTLVGAALGAVVVNYAKTFFTSGPLAPYWLFMLGALFILVTLLLPKGIVGTVNSWWMPWKERTIAADEASAAREEGVSETNMAEQGR